MFFMLYLFQLALLKKEFCLCNKLTYLLFSVLNWDIYMSGENKSRT